jgi:hypothetical protein
LVSTFDRVADVDLTRREIEESVSSLTDEELLKLREDVVGDVGLLCLYPISKDSKPKDTSTKQGNRRRLPMEAVDHLLGVGIFFPESRGGSTVTYMSADLSSAVQEDFDDDLAELDRADEQAGADEDRVADQTPPTPVDGSR